MVLDVVKLRRHLVQPHLSGIDEPLDHADDGQGRCVLGLAGDRFLAHLVDDQQRVATGGDQAALARGELQPARPGGPAFQIPLQVRKHPVGPAPGELKLNARFYGNEAMKMLRDAVAKGFNNAQQMKEDACLAPLREWEDFQKLLTELQKE